MPFRFKGRLIGSFGLEKAKGPPMVCHAVEPTAKSLAIVPYGLGLVDEKGPCLPEHALVCIKV
jgi:hypothetical protein